MVWPFASRRERVRREASEWIARLNGPDSARHREAFQAWYSQSPDHSETYDRLAALFSAAGALERPAARHPEHTLGGRSRSGPMGRLAIAAGIACTALLAFLLLSGRTMAPPSEALQQYATFAVDEGEQRQVELRDGSRLLLGPGSRLEVAISSGERRLRLLSGRGRITVASDPRPFLVTAGRAEIAALGTQFDVSLDEGRAIVALIEGRLEVTYPAGGGARRLVRLLAGQQLVVEPASRETAGSAGEADASAHNPPASFGMLEFDETPLASAVAQINRGSARIRIGDPSLSDLRVSGAFRAGDADGFAQAVASAFNLEVARASDGVIILRPRERRLQGA